MSTTATEYRFQITGMDCANCAKSVETGVQNLPDVETAALNFTTATLRVNGPVTADRIVSRVRELGYDVVADDRRRPRRRRRRPRSGAISGAAGRRGWRSSARCSSSPA